MRYVFPDCPMNVTITGASDDGSIDNGAQLHCSASANPSASYQWYFITSTSVGVVINETISVTATGNYTCKATNIINGGNCTAYTIQEITISKYNIFYYWMVFRFTNVNFCHRMTTKPGLLKTAGLPDFHISLNMTKSGVRPVAKRGTRGRPPSEGGVPRWI